MTRTPGSAATTAIAVAPQSAVAQCVSRCAERLAHSAQIAALAAAGPEPWRGAEYLLYTVNDLSADLRYLRAVLRSR